MRPLFRVRGKHKNKYVRSGNRNKLSHELQGVKLFTSIGISKGRLAWQLLSLSFDGHIAYPLHFVDI